MAARLAVRLWKRLKNSCSVVQSRKVGRQEVGICTVARSSADSSVVVPMKSNERQAQANFSSQLIKTCCMCVCTGYVYVTTIVHCVCESVCECVHAYSVVIPSIQCNTCV